MLTMIPNGIQVTLTPQEKLAVIENYKAVKALIRQMRQQFGDDPRRDAMVHQEFGFSFGKWLKKATKTVLAPAAKIGKAIIKSPITKLVVGGIATVYPAVGVPLSAALLVADKAITMAEDVDKARRDIGKTLIKNTKAAALTDPNAARAFAVMKTVHSTRKAAGIPAGKRMNLEAAKVAASNVAKVIPLTRQTHILPGLPAAVYKGRAASGGATPPIAKSVVMVPHAKATAASLASSALRAKATAKAKAGQLAPRKAVSSAAASINVPKGTPLYGGFIITTEGRTIPGTKIARLAGDM